MKFDVEFDADKTKRRLAKLPDAARTELVTVARLLDRELVDYARFLASGPLVNVKSGRYVKSIHGSVRSTQTMVTGKVASSAPEAHFIETGAVRKAMDILPNAAKALSFLMNGRRVFAARVHHPGSTEKPRHLLQVALDDIRAEIVAEMTSALHRGLAVS
jgi:hypothetical protein